MPCFICSKCECVENTALGHWWSRGGDHDLFIWPEGMEQYYGKGLCSECAPIQYNDGSLSRFGTWHGKFPKEHYADQPYKEELLNIKEFKK